MNSGRGPAFARAIVHFVVQCVVLCVVAAFGLASGLAGQDPPDTVRIQPDTAVSDSLGVLDSLTLDSLRLAGLLPDSLDVDSLAVDTLPLLAMGAPASSEAGVWEWDQEELFWISGFTIADLLRDVPGLWITRTGDYGAPVTTTGFGTGRLRVRIDGVEWVPYEAGVVDLSQIPLTGLRTVRVRRAAGGVTIDLYSLRPDDARAYSVIEAGTGDLNTNLFRGTFMLPRALGGTLAGAMERVDTQGDRREEPGALTGIWLRYTVNRGRRFGIEAEFRSRSIQQQLFAPEELSRRDLTLRSRYLLTEGLVLGAHYTSASVEGRGVLVPDTVAGEGVGQLGVDLSFERNGAWGRAGFRSLRAEGLPSSMLDVDLGFADDRYGGFGVEMARQGWEGQSTSRTGLRAWTTDRYGPYGFFELDRGSTGIPYMPLLNGGLVRVDSTEVVGVPATYREQDRRSSRIGAGVRLRGAEVEFARVSVDADSIQPLGLPTDRGPFALPGSARSGVEARLSVPVLLLDELSFQGSAIRWDESEDPWPYLPRLSYDARLHYRNTFLPTENFEMLAILGIRERESMTVFTAVDTVPPTPAEGEDPVPLPIADVPFSQAWYARLEIRVVSLRIFVEWENLTLRDANQDFPERILPRTRAMYGVRWTLRN